MVPELPRGAVYIDLLVPQGTSERADELQTRLDLVAGGDWRVLVDDGSMERSSPMQPVRAGDERLWLVRSHPFTPPENLQVAASLAVEISGMCQARLAAVGVYGLYAWGFILVDDFHSLFGLLLLDWLYNPRITSSGEVLESDDPAKIEAEFQAKAGAFSQLWTVETSQLLMSQLPPGVLQPVESYQALSLLGPGGRVDPRLWQGLAMQLVLPVVQMFSSSGNSIPIDQNPAAGQGGAAPTAPAAASGSTPASGTVSEPKQEQPDDGLTPLARAQKEAERRRAAGEQLAEPPADEGPSQFEGLASWQASGEGLVLFLSVA